MKYNVKVNFIAGDYIALEGYGYGSGDHCFEIVANEGLYVHDGKKYQFFPMHTIVMMAYEESPKEPSHDRG